MEYMDVCIKNIRVKWTPTPSDSVLKLNVGIFQLKYVAYVDLGLRMHKGQDLFVDSCFCSNKSSTLLSSYGIF